MERAPRARSIRDVAASSGSALVRVGGLWLTIAGAMAVFYSLNPAFLNGPNLLDLIRATSTLAIVALAQTLVIISGELDLSIGSTYALAPTVVAVVWIDHDTGIWVALVIGLAAGVLVGLVNSALAVYAKIPSFIVTLGMLSLVLGLTQQIGKSRSFTPGFLDPPMPSSQLSVFDAIGASEPFGIPAQVIWLIGATLVFTLLLHRSLFGFRLFAIGGNPNATCRAAASRAIPDRTFVVCAAAAALAGIIDFSFIGATQVSTAGSSLTFPVFAAVIIGGASLSGGSGSVLGTLTGALLLGVLSNGLAFNGVGGGYRSSFHRLHHDRCRRT